MLRLFFITIECVLVSSHHHGSLILIVPIGLCSKCSVVTLGTLNALDLLIAFLPLFFFSVFGIDLPVPESQTIHLMTKF